MFGAGRLWSQAASKGQGTFGEGRLGSEKLGNAKIEQSGNAFGGNEDVSGLDVAVNDKVLVGIVDGGTDALKELEAAMNAEFVGIAIVVDGLALNILHHEIGKSLFGGAAIE